MFLIDNVLASHYIFIKLLCYIYMQCSYFTYILESVKQFNFHSQTNPGNSYQSSLSALGKSAYLYIFYL